MKRALLSALMMILLLTGCGAGAEARIQQSQSELIAAERLCFTANVTEDLETEVFRCTLAVESTAEQTEITVTAPEEIAGVRAVLREGEAELAYGDVRLSLGAGLRNRLGPAEAMPLLCIALRSGHVLRAWTERDGEAELIAAESWCTDDLTWRVWYDAETLTPVHAALWEGEREIISCAIESFQADISQKG